MNVKRILFSGCLLLATAFFAQAQELKFPDMDKSPMDAAHYPRESAYNNYMDDADKKDRQIKVLYCRPKKKDRVIFGELVPYGKDWRLGANEATEVTFYQPVEIGGKFINRGTYTMFAEVFPDYWIIKISTQRFIAGSENRDVSKDIVAVSVPVINMPDSRESFAIGFQRVDDESCNMVFEWDRTRTELPISFNPVYLAGEDASPMDLVQFPNESRLQNYLKPEEIEKNAPKIRVVYSRPQKKGRDIFGNLVAYGEPWRLGANESTEVTFFNKVKIGDQEIRPGTYGLMAKVNKDNWEFVLHTNIPSWGTHNHDAAANVASMTVPVEKTPMEVEALSVVFDKKDGNMVHMVVAWDRSMVRLPIELMD